MQMEGVGGAGGTTGTHGEGDLDGGVRGQRVVAARREEVGGGDGARKNLQKGRDGGGNEGDVVDEELGTVL